MISSNRSGRDFAVARAIATPPIADGHRRFQRYLNRPDHLLEAFGETRADGFVLPDDFACGGRH